MDINGIVDFVRLSTLIDTSSSGVVDALADVRRAEALLSGSLLWRAGQQQVGSEGRDENLTAQEAAARLSMSIDWIYRNAATLPFTVRIGRRVLFSARGLERWARARTGRSGGRHAG